MPPSLQPVTREEALAGRRVAATPFKALGMLAMLAGLVTVVAVTFLVDDPTAVPAWITVLVAAPLTVIGVVGARHAMSRVRYRATVYLSWLRLIAILAVAVLLIWALGSASMALGITWGWTGLKFVLIAVLVGAVGLHLATSTLFMGDCLSLRFRNTAVPWDEISHVVITAGSKPDTLEIGAGAAAGRRPTGMPVRAGELLTDLPYRTVVRRRGFDLDRLRWALNQSGRTDLPLVERGAGGERVLGYANRWTNAPTPDGRQDIGVAAPMPRPAPPSAPAPTAWPTAPDAPTETAWSVPPGIPAARNHKPLLIGVAAGTTVVVCVTAVIVGRMVLGNTERHETRQHSTYFTVAATLDVGDKPQEAAIDANAHRVLVANTGSCNISVIDTAANDVTDTIELGSYPGDDLCWPYGVAVDPAGRIGYVTVEDRRVLTVVDLTAKAVAGTVELGGRPMGVAFDPDTHTVFTTDSDYPYPVSVIDTITGEVMGTVAAGDSPTGVSVDPAGHTAYVVNRGSNTATMIDTATRTVIATVDVGRGPYRVAVDPERHIAYTADSGGDTVTVIGPDHTVTAAVDVGTNPNGVAVDADRRLAYVTNKADDTVSVIDTATNTVIDTVPVGTGPMGVAVDPTTHAVYVTNSGSHSVSVIARK